MQALKGSKYCFTHAPEVGAARALARKTGGKRHRTPHYGDASIIPHEVKNLEDANKILAYTLAETVPMENSIARARLLLALYDSFVKSFEIGELEKRIQALEAQRK
jgi:flagellin-specific chaperone FliS